MFPEETSCLLIFRGYDYYVSKRRQKLERLEVFNARQTTLSFLNWSNYAITFDRSDHLERISRPGRYLLVIDPIVGTIRLSKVLIDRGNRLNILYSVVYDAMGLG